MGSCLATRNPWGAGCLATPAQGLLWPDCVQRRAVYCITVRCTRGADVSVRWLDLQNHGAVPHCSGVLYHNTCKRGMCMTRQTALHNRAGWLGMLSVQSRSCHHSPTQMQHKDVICRASCTPTAIYCCLPSLKPKEWPTSPKTPRVDT